MSDTLNTVTYRVGKIIKRINAPFVSNMRMRMIPYTINNWISKSCVWMIRVNLGSEWILPFLIKPHPHLIKQFQVFFDRSVSILWRKSLSSFLSHLFSCLRTNKSISLLDQLHRAVIKSIEIIRRMGNLPRFITHPSHVFLYILDVFNILFGRISIVKTKITFSTIHLCLHKTKSHSLAVTNVKITVGLRRESSQHNIPVFVNSILNELFGV